MAVLVEVVPIGGHHVLLDAGELREAPVRVPSPLRINRDRLRKTARNPVFPEQADVPLMHCVRKRILDIGHRDGAQMGGQFRVPHGVQEVLEGQRPQVQILDPSYGHRETGVGEGELHERTRGHDMQFGSFLVEVSQCRQRFRRRLDLVEKQQVGSGRDGLPGEQRERGENPSRVPNGERLAQLRVALEVDGDQRPVCGLGKLAHQR